MWRSEKKQEMEEVGEAVREEGGRKEKQESEGKKGRKRKKQKREETKGDA